MATPTFGISTADEFFMQVVLPQHLDFVTNNSSVRHALLAIICAYHMYEWVNGMKFSLSDFKRRYPNNSSVADDLELARMLANDTKHYLRKVRTRTQAGFSSGFSDGFARPLVIETPTGGEVGLDALLRSVVEFWRAQKLAGAF